MRLGAWRERKRREAAALALHGRLVAQARLPEFYAQLGVPDSIDGRFDMLALHLFLVLERLRAADPPRDALAQALFDTAVTHLDRGLRESGVGDEGVARRLKAMVKAFYGRATAYRTALQAEDGESLEAALRRNVFRGAPVEPSRLTALARYVRAQAEALAAQDDDAVTSGRMAFAALAPTAAMPH